MNKRLAGQLAIVTMLAALVVLIQPRPEPGAAGAAPAEPPRAEPRFVDLPKVPAVRGIRVDEIARAAELPMVAAPVPVGRDAPSGPQQCQFGGIARNFTEGFEPSTWPRNTKWVASDPFGISPGVIDDVVWARRTCEASVGGASMWSVGGGRIGKPLSCEGADKQYPAVPHPQNTARGIRSLARYSPIDLANTSAVGVRVTFDYMARMPAKSLFIGIGDSEKVVDGVISFTGYDFFDPDTAGEWRRGVIVEGAELDKVLGASRAILGVFYTDPPPRGEGPVTAGMYGAFVDNFHFDVKYVANPCPIESPTVLPTIPPTETNTPSPEPTEPATRTPIVLPTTAVPPTRTPSPTPRVTVIQLPILLKGHDLVIQYVPIPTAPSPTITPTPTRTPTPTPTLTPSPTNTVPPTPTRTPSPTDTPRPTPTPTWTPIPFVDIQVEALQPFTLGNVYLEWVRVTNFGTGAQAMRGWRVFASRARPPESCYFPDDLILGPSQSFELRTGRDATAGIREDEVLGPAPGIVCNTKLIWDNNFGIAELYNEFNEVKDRWCYEREGPYYCD